MKYIKKTDTKKTNNGKKTLTMDEPFFQTPKSLFRNKKYNKLTPASKLVYIELLDRIGLSMANGMHDEDDNYYVKMSRENSMQLIGVSWKTFERAKDNLVDFGLLEVREINKRNHHLYVFLPDKETYTSDDGMPDIPESYEINTNINKSNIGQFDMPDF
ncbi:MAG: replication initiator domain protein [Bacillales bacterium]|jgi:hypothetical protein|nr:replication initiator domain protein [Bacillales bacterium]